MFDFLTNPLGEMWDAVRPHFEPVNPEQGSQGAARPGESDGSVLGGIGQFVGDFGRGLSQEGLGGLLDPAGMMDRQNAQRELASRFNVLPDNAVGTREQNQVTEEEFQRIARTYSDIRRGNSDLKLADRPANMSEADYAAYRRNAMGDIADIMQTESGRGLVDSLANAPLQADGKTHRTTTINPRLDGSGALDPSNAEGGGRFGQSGYANYAAGMDALPGRDNLRSDVTLYHELTHAHHAIYNTWDAGSVSGGADNGVGQFEHQAAGLGTHANDPFSENRYRGERRRIGALNVGERTRGAESDDNMTHRDTYSLPLNPDGTPAPRTNAAPLLPRNSFVRPTGTGSGKAGPGGAGSASRIGRSTDEGRDHHHH